MKELIGQYSKVGFVLSDEEKEIADTEYIFNEPVRLKTYHIGAKKQPSIIQNNLMHACFTLVADNSKKFINKKQVKFACKVDLHFVHEDLVHIDKNGMVHFEYRSFRFDQLGHMERCKVFDRAFEWCAGILGITVEQLIEKAKERMYAKN